MMEKILFYGGIGLFSLAIVGGIAAGILLRYYHKRLQAALEKEYGQIKK